MSTDTPVLNPINEAWFKEQFALRGLSQRGLARLLDLDPSAVTHTIQGKRRMQMDEAVQTARFLGVSLEEVLKNAGLPIGESPPLPLVGYIDDRYELHVGEKERTVQIPARVPHGSVAVVMKTGLSKNGLVIFKPNDSVDPSAIGRLSVAKMKNGPILLALIERDYEPGRYVLETRDGKINDAELQSATPVLWIRP